MNLQIENVKQQVINVINNSNLPIGTIYYMFKDILNEVGTEYDRALASERQQQIQQMQQQQQVEQGESEDGEIQN